MDVEKKSEGEILFPGTTIGDINVKPWSFEKFMTVIPMILDGYSVLQQEKVDFSVFKDLTEGKKEDVTKVYLSLAPVFPKIGAIIKDVVALTIESTPAEVGAMEFDKVFSVALVTLIQNAVKIKNFFGLGLTAIAAFRTQG